MEILYENLLNFTWQQGVMILIGLVLIYLAIKKEMELVHKYEDTMPWKSQRHAKSLHELQSAREKIYQSLKGV